MEKKLDREKILFIARIAVPILIALVSLFVLAPHYSDVKSYDETIATLDAEKENVVKLTGASTAAAAAITLLPGDICTPVAEKLMDLTKDFTIVLCAIYFEKFMLTVVGYFVFQWILPLSSMAFLLAELIGRTWLRSLAVRVFIFGVCVFLMIPVSVKISTLINTAYQDSIDATISSAQESAQEIRGAAEETEAVQIEEEKNVFEKLFEKAGESVTALTQSITEATERLKSTVDRYIDALAVMIVTSCVIPIVVIVAFLYLAKALIGIDIKLPRRRRGQEETEKPAAAS